MENSIGWCDQTTNAVTGCDKVSPGCKNCYAEAGTRARVLRSQGKETWGAKGKRVPVNFEPVFRRLNKLCVCGACRTANRWLDDDGRMKGYQCFACGRFDTMRRIRLFADSNSDWLDPKWPTETLARFLDAVRLAPNVDVLLLTKRIENFVGRLEEVMLWLDNKKPEGKDDDLWGFLQDWLTGESDPDGLTAPTPPPHVWLGVSVEDQRRADERIPLLLKTPAAVRFLSVEPLLEKVDLTTVAAAQVAGGRFGQDVLATDFQHVDWVIVGGESGKNRRDCGVEAIESVVEQCVHAGVPVYCKQDSAFFSGQQGRLSEAAWLRKEFPKAREAVAV